MMVSSILPHAIDEPKYSSVCQLGPEWTAPGWGSGSVSVPGVSWCSSTCSTEPASVFPETLSVRLEPAPSPR